MILRAFRFVDLETPVEYFDTWLTPISHFFARNHMHEPSELDPHDWRLSIGGTSSARRKPASIDISACAEESEQLEPLGF